MPVSAILLDLGNTLVRFDWGRAVRALAPGHISDGPAFVEMLQLELDYLGYEVGRMGTDEFMVRLRAAIGFQGSEEALRRGYADIFSAMREREALVAGLAGRYRLAIVSNTSAIHVAWFEKEFPWLCDIPHRFYSCEMNVMKPDHDYYERVIAEMGLPAAEMVFVDDREDNCEGARACGLQVIHAGPDEDLAARLRDLGVAITSG